MKNVWKGALVGAVVGAAAGAGADRRARGATPEPLAERLPSATRVRDGVQDAVDRVRQVDLASALGDATGSARHTLATLTGDDREALHAVGDAVTGKAAQAAATVSGLAGAVKDGASRAATGVTEAGGAAVSKLSGSGPAGG